MNEAGRKFDVIIEPVVIGGVESKSAFSVWADAGNTRAIMNVEGVTRVFTNTCKTQYDVYVDARYSMATVKCNVVLALGTQNG